MTETSHEQPTHCDHRIRDYCFILLGFAALILWKVYDNQISLVGLLSEPAGPDGPKASLSRFQFLIFTFVIAGLYLLLSIEAGTFVDIPTNVLGLLGISGGSFLISKAVNTAKEGSGAPDKTT